MTRRPRWQVLVSVSGLLLLLGSSAANKPVFDVSNNMRLLLLPTDTKMGTVVYRLRASDSEEQYPLTFRVYGDEPDLISVDNVDCSMTICEADVVLTKPLDPDKDVYTFSLEVADTRGDKTVVKSEIQPTKRTSAFIGAPRIIRIPETTRANALLESFTIMENLNLYRGVSCSLLPRDDRQYFTLGSGLPTSNKGESRCDLRLKQELDFEARSSFVLQIVAENAWTDSTVDTRNVAVHEFIVEVEDVQDTPPYFLDAPPVTRDVCSPVLPETAEQDDEVCKVLAFDGDYAHPRKIRYGLDPSGLPYSNFFKIDADSGVVYVRKDLKDLDVSPGTPVILRVVAEEVVDGEDSGVGVDDAVLVASGQERTTAAVEIAIVVDDVINRKPKFLQNHYITNLEEGATEGTKLVFEGGLDRVEDMDKGENGLLTLWLSGAEDVFEISPALVEHAAQFVISVKNSKKLDYEKTQQIDFTIHAREVGPGKLSATADVSVQLVDMNDNPPRFEKDKYEVRVHENERPGSVILKVTAFDSDTGDNADIRYTRLLAGDDPVVKGLRLDPVTGEISVVNNHYLDREILDKHILTVEAVDKDGQSEGRTAQATIVLSILDVNDVKPTFLKKKYQGFMNKELTRLRNDLQVEAVDGDLPGSKNSQIRYEIIHGNYDKKFSIDEVTGVISVQEPLDYSGRSIASHRRRGGFVRRRTDLRQRRQLELDESTEADTEDPQYASLSERRVEPVITLMVRAYDLGIPSLDAEVPVHIYTEDVFTRTMRFIISEMPQRVEREQDRFSDLISAMTGGHAEIQDIQPYFGDDDSGNREVFTQVDIERSAKTVSVKPKKTLVDVLIRYPADSVVDVTKVTSKLVSSNSSSVAVNNVTSAANSTGGQPGSKATDGATTVEQLEQRNATLFWVMIILCLIIAMGILIAICCCCCPGCYWYSGDKVNSIGPSPTGSSQHHRLTSASGSDIQVLTVKDSRGREIKDARFVEILKSARDRMRSAASLGRGSSNIRRWRVRSQESLFDHNDRQRGTERYPDHRQNRSYQIVDPRGGSSSDDPENILLVREAAGKRSNQARTLRLEELNPSSLRAEYELERNREVENGDSRKRPTYHDRPAPTERSRIFKLIETDSRHPSRDGEDVQILRLDDDTRREETYKRVGGSEVLNLEQDLDKDSTRGHKDNASQTLQVEVHDSGEEGNKAQLTSSNFKPNEPLSPRRSQSELDLFRQQHNHQGEFYTAIGPDGKEIILKRYLNDQTPDSNPFMERGFLNMAMYHLNNQQQHQGIEGPAVRNHHLEEYDNRPNENQLYAPQFGPDITPKHQIRTPILEETESNLAAEDLKSRQSRKDKYKISYENSDASVLRFRINDGRDSPEPAYTETKASILRRRNTMAKILQEEDKQQQIPDQDSNQPGNANKARTGRGSKANRHWSLNDLTRAGPNPHHGGDGKMRRWNSLSNDELTRRDDPKYSLSNTRLSHDLRASQRGRINLVPMDKNNNKASSNNTGPRKFSKYNGNAKQQNRTKSQVFYDENDKELYYDEKRGYLQQKQREPLWSRIGTGGGGRGGRHPVQEQQQQPGVLNQRAMQYLMEQQQHAAGNHPHNLVINPGHPDDLQYTYPDQLIDSTSSSENLPSRSSSPDSSFQHHHHHQQQQLQQHGQYGHRFSDDEAEDELGEIQMRSKPDRDGPYHHLSTGFQMMPNQAIPHRGNQEYQFTFDQNGEVVRRRIAQVPAAMIQFGDESQSGSPRKGKRRSTATKVTPRYMNWYKDHQKSSRAALAGNSLPPKHNSAPLVHLGDVEVTPQRRLYEETNRRRTVSSDPIIDIRPRNSMPNEDDDDDVMTGGREQPHLISRSLSAEDLSSRRVMSKIPPEVQTSELSSSQFRAARREEQPATHPDQQVEEEDEESGIGSLPQNLHSTATATAEEHPHHKKLEERKGAFNAAYEDTRPKSIVARPNSAEVLIDS